MTLSRRVLLGTVAAATVLPASRGRAQQAPIRIGVLNDQSGLYRDFGGPTSVLAARMAVEDSGGNVLGRRYAAQPNGLGITQTKHFAR